MRRPARTFGARSAPSGPAGRAAGVASRPAGSRAVEGEPRVCPASSRFPPRCGKGCCGGARPGRGFAPPPLRHCRPGQSPLPSSLPGHLAAAPGGTAASRRARSEERAGRAEEKGSAHGRGCDVRRGAPARRCAVSERLLGAQEQQPQPDPNLLSYETCRCKVALSSACFVCALVRAVFAAS